MKDRLWKYIQNRFTGDLFKRTQTRLTLQYTGLLMVFLSLFIIFVYGLLYIFSFYQQEAQIRDLAVQESNVVIDYVEHYNMPQLVKDQQTIFTLGEDQFFYYLTDNSGNVLIGNEIIHPMHQDLLKLVQGWNPGNDETRYESISHERHHNHVIQLLMTGVPISVEGHTLGTLYIGKDISFQYQLLHWLLIILIVLVLVFAMLAFFISQFMSKRAMVPIINSYTKQREFVADASHELRTPLSVLLSSIDTLQLEDSIESDPFSSRVLSNMKDEVKRMSKLVGDLLTLARSDSEIKLTKEYFDIGKEVKRIIQTFTPLAAEKQISLKENSPDAIHVYADADRITQLIYILLDNAIKYTPEGGKIDLTLTTSHHKHREWLQIEVQDTGKGINSSDHQRIFDRFYREDKARSRVQGGHGLGLAIAKWIVDAHQGTIQVSSIEGEGSTFMVLIPLSNESKKHRPVKEME